MKETNTIAKEMLKQLDQLEQILQSGLSYTPLVKIGDYSLCFAYDWTPNINFGVKYKEE